MKRSDVVRLKAEHPDLLTRALEIERRSQKTNRTNRGLGGEGNKWADLLALDDAQAKTVAREFSDSQGNIPYFSNAGQMKYGGANSTISEALLKAAERTTFAGGANGAQAVGRTVQVNINTGNARTETVNTDEAGAAAVVRALQAASLSAGR
jgi:hypothetical protein